MVADALIYHPTVTHYMRYVATTVGRDKILRTLQYFSRFYAWYLYRTNNPTSSIVPFTTMKVQFGLTRKIMRIGKFVEHFRAASELYDSLQGGKGGTEKLRSGEKDAIVQMLQVIRQLGYGGYMLLDMITVPDVLGIVKWEGAKRVQVQAYRCWMVGLVASAVAGVVGEYRLRERKRGVDEKDAEGKVEGVKIQRQLEAANVQLISDLCDLTVPTTALGYASFDDGIVGLAGTVSSLLGVYGVWQKTA